MTMSESDVTRQQGRWAKLLSNRAVFALLSGVGGFLAIYILSLLSSSLEVALLVAPFGASCVLVFALPQSPLAQPKNVIGGHLISAFIGICVFALMGAQPLSFALAVGLAIAAMQVTETLHPPAGADPIVVLFAGASWKFLLMPILIGTLIVVVVAALYHRLISRCRYPL
jgi:CBS-domain-containing membrane protein